jgi:putative transposase
MVVRSPSVTSCATTYSQSSLSSWLATTEGGPPQIADGAPPKRAPGTKKGVEKQSAGKARRIRVYPNAAQKDKLMHWFGTARWTYNRCLDLVREKMEAETDREMMTKKELRAKAVNKDNYIGASDKKWVLETPYEVRDAAMGDLLDAYSTNFAKMRKNNATHRFVVRHRSKKSPQQAIMIRGKCYKSGVFYPTFFGKEPLRSSEPLPETVDYDCKLVHTRLDHFYFILPMPLAVASDSQAPTTDRVVALDPGVRTFHTAYDPSGYVIEFGKGDIGRIYRLCAHMDALQSRIERKENRPNGKRRRHMRQALYRMQARVRNLIDECHKKMVHFLCMNYSVVLLPSFKTQEMAIRKQRNIGSKTARAMLTWSHYRFKQRMLFKRQEMPWCKVVVCDEAYTSQTCGRCGMLNKKLGAKKVFSCPSCHLKVDRDANAARNILLKNSSLLGLRAEGALGLSPSLMH